MDNIEVSNKLPDDEIVMANQGPTAAKAKLQFHYLKSPDYREVSCHGVFGGITPNGKQVCMSVFSERAPIPRMVQYDVETKDGEVAFEEASAVPTLTDTRQGIVRHVEYSMYLDLDMARSLRSWLDARIKTLERN